jgi:ribosomal protein S18 acetylase RimI-like enzyme
MRSTPSKVLGSTAVNVQHSSIQPRQSRKVTCMTHAFCLELIDSPTHPLLPGTRELLRQYQRSLGIDLCFQDFETELLELPGAYAPPDGRLYTALIGVQLAGSIALRRHDANSCEMKRLYLRPEFLGRGFGKLMAEHIIQDARTIGYERILLDTLPSMQAAQGIYQKLGFRETKAYVFNPVEGVRYMELQL